MKLLDFTLRLLLFITILLVFPCVRCRSSDILLEEKKTLDNILGKEGRYDARIRPPGVNNSDAPVVSYVNMFIRSISKMNEVDMDYSIQITFRQQWIDERLKYDDMQGLLRYLKVTDHNSIWTPDLFFSNEKEGHFHNLIKPNQLMRIYQSGHVLYSKRLSLVLSCPMNFRNFPLDTQVCSITMASYGYTTEDVVLLWKQEAPVQITKLLNNLSFTLKKFTTGYCTSGTNTGEYSCLRLDFVFERVLTYYLYQFYIPFCGLVMLSWVTFWIDKNQFTIRIFLAVAAMLSMSILPRDVNQSLPKTPYMKASDIWAAVCYLFAFAVILENATINYVNRKTRKQNAAKQSSDIDPAKLVEVEFVKKNGFNVESQETGKLNWRVWIAKLPRGSSNIDVLSRIIFPIAFAIFNVIYWSIYCSKLN